MQICITGTNVGAFLTGLTCTNLDFKMKEGNLFWLSLGRRKPEARQNKDILKVWRAELLYLFLQITND